MLVLTGSHVALLTLPASPVAVSQVKLASLVGSGRDVLSQSFRDVELQRTTAAQLWEQVCPITPPWVDLLGMLLNITCM